MTEGTAAPRAGWLDLLALGFVVVLAAVTTPVSGAYVSGNGAEYLVQAERLARGLAPGNVLEDKGTRSIRGTLFPRLMAGAFRVFGTDVGVAMLVIRGLAAACLVMVFLLGRLLYGRTAGLAAALVAWAMPGLAATAATLGIDTTPPAFMLLSLLFLAIGERRGSVMWAAAAGVVIAMAIYVKESGFILFGVPVLLVATAPRVAVGAAAKRAAIALAAAAMALLPLVWQVVAGGYGAASVAGVAASSVDGTGAGAQAGVGWREVLVTQLPQTLDRLYREQLFVASPLAPVLVAALVWLLWRAVRYRQRGDVLVAAAFVCFLPITLWSAAHGYRIGQLAFVFYLTAIAFGAALGRLTDRVAARPVGDRRRWVPAAAAVLVLLGTGAELLAHPGGTPTWEMWRHPEVGLRVVVDRPFEAKGRFTREHETAAAWLRDRQGVVAADAATHAPLLFFLQRDSVAVFNPITDIHLASTHARSTERVLFAMTPQMFRDGRFFINVVTQEEVVRQLRESGARFLLVSGRFRYVTAYLERVPWAVRRFETGATSIYEIDAARVAPIDDFVFGPSLQVASGDGTRTRVRVGPRYQRFEVAGVLKQEDHIWFNMDQPGTFHLDDVSFESARKSGGVANLLRPADAAFEEPDIDWAAAGSGYAVERVADPEACNGTHALRVSGQSAGDTNTNRAVLLATKFEYIDGAENRLTFCAKGTATFPIRVAANHNLLADMEWLASARPDLHARASVLLVALGIQAADLRRISILAPEVTP